MQRISVSMAFITLFLVGCGESTKDRMYRMAREQAAALEAEEAEEKRLAAEAPAPSPAPAPDVPAAPAVPPPVDPAPMLAQADAVINPVAVPAAQPSTDPVPTTTEDGASEGQPVPPPESPVATFAPSMPVLSPNGQYLAIVRSENQIDAFDVKSRKVFRSFFVPGLKPTAIAFDEDRHLVVGTAGGSVKVFKLVTLNGLDEFTKARIQRSDGVLPSPIHTAAITSLVVDRGTVLSGDELGFVRKSSLEQKASEVVGEVNETARFLQAYQGEQVFFLAGESGEVKFLRRNGKASDLRPFANIRERPIDMLSLPSGKGLAIVGENGNVSLSLPKDDSTETVLQRLSNVPVVSARFARNGRSLLLATATGSILEYPFPLATGTEIRVQEGEIQYLAATQASILSSSALGLLNEFATDGKLVRTYQLRQQNKVTAFASATEGWTAIGDDQGFVHIFARSGGALLTEVRAASDPIDQLKIGPSGQLLYSSGNNFGTIAVPQVLPVPKSTAGAMFLSRHVERGSLYYDPTGNKLLLDTESFGSKDGVADYAKVETPFPARCTTGWIGTSRYFVATEQGVLLAWDGNSNSIPVEIYRTPSGKPLTAIIGEQDTPTLGFDTDGNVWNLDSKDTTVEDGSSADVSTATIPEESSSYIDLQGNGVSGGLFAPYPAAQLALREAEGGVELIVPDVRADATTEGSSKAITWRSSGQKTIALNHRSLRFAELSNDGRRIITVDTNGEVYFGSVGKSSKAAKLESNEIILASDAGRGWLLVSDSETLRWLDLASPNQTGKFEVAAAEKALFLSQQSQAIVMDGNGFLSQVSNQNGTVTRLAVHLEPSVVQGLVALEDASILVVDDKGRLTRIGNESALNAASPPASVVLPISAGHVMLCKEGVVVVDSKTGDYALLDKSDLSVTKYQGHCEQLRNAKKFTAVGEFLTFETENGALSAMHLQSGLGWWRSLTSSDELHVRFINGHFGIVSNDGNLHIVEAPLIRFLSREENGLSVPFKSRRFGQLEASVGAPAQTGKLKSQTFGSTNREVIVLESRLGITAGKECVALNARGGEIARMVSNGELFVSMSLASDNTLFTIDQKGKVRASGRSEGFETVRNPLAIHCINESSIAVVAPASVHFYDAHSGAAIGKLDLGFKTRKVEKCDRHGCRLIDDRGEVHVLSWPQTRWTQSASSTVASVEFVNASRQGTERDNAGAESIVLVATKEGQVKTVDLRDGEPSSESTVISADYSILGAVSTASKVFVIGTKMEIGQLQGSKLLAVANAGESELVSLRVSEARDQLVALASDGSLHSLALDVGSKAEWKKLAVELNPLLYASVGGDRIAFTNNSKTIQFGSISGGARELENLNRQITSFDWSLDDRLGVVVDGSHQVRLLSAVASELSKVLMLDNARFDKVAVHPGARTVAASGKEVGNDDLLCFWDAASGSLLQSEKLDAAIDQLRFSADGSKCAARLVDGSLRIYRFNGQLLNVIGNDFKVGAFAFAEQGASVLLMTDQGELRQERFAVQDSIRIHESPIKQIVINNTDRWIVRCEDGTVSGENENSWDREDGAGVRFQLVGNSPVSLSSDVDGSRVVIGGIKSDGPILQVWNIDNNQRESEIPASFDIPIRDGLRAVQICNDGKAVLVAGNDNVIRMIDLASRKIVATFSGHTDSVVGLQANSQGDKFVSFDKNNVIKVWQWPKDYSTTADEPLSGRLVSTSNAGEALVGAVETLNVDEDPLDTARRALFSGDSTTDAQKRFYSEIEGPLELRRAANQAAEAIATLEASVASGTGDPTELARLRKEYSRLRRQLLPLGSGGQSTSLTDDHSNLLFSGETAFRFQVNQPFRPVHMRISEDRFLYAARSGEQFNEDDENKPAEPELGAVISWDFGFSGIKAHAWEFPNFVVSDIYSAPGDRGIFSFPNLQMFANDGTSRVVNTSARTWCVSPDSLSTQERLLVVGQASPTDQQAPVLVTYKASDLVKQTTAPLCSFSAFDGVVTAIAFANRHPVIAFAVRDRATTKIFLADPRTLSVDSMKLVYQNDHAMPYRGGGGKQGITSLAFSPGDDVLVAHGEFESAERSGDDDVTSEFRFNGWFIDWSQPGISPEICFDEMKQSTPLIEAGFQAIRFLPDAEFSPENFKKALVAKKAVEKSRKKNGNASSSRSAGRLLMCYKTGQDLHVHDLVSGEEHYKVSIPTTQKGMAQFSMTAGGRWLAYGNDQGEVRIEDMFAKKSYSLTLNQRPAHTGPVVGVAIAEPDPKIGLPEFVATAGEENQVKVWDLISVLGKADAKVTKRVSTK